MVTSHLETKLLVQALPLVHLTTFINNMDRSLLRQVKTQATSVNMALSGPCCLSGVASLTTYWLRLHRRDCCPHPFRAGLGQRHKTVTVNYYILPCRLEQLHLEAEEDTRNCKVHFSIC